jgi:hypothetical protein
MVSQLTIFFIEKHVYFSQNFRTDFFWLDSFQKHQKFSSIQIVIFRIAAERSFFQAFIADHKTISIPKEGFHTVSLPVEENEKRAREQLSWKELLYDGSEPFKAFVHADGIFAKEDARRQG